MALDTGSGYNLIKNRVLPEGFEQRTLDDCELPPLDDSNRKKLALQGAVTLRVRLGNKFYKANFIVTTSSAVDVIIETNF